MKRTLLALGLCSLLFACKKSSTDDDPGNNPGNNPSGPALSATDVQHDMAAGKTTYYFTVSGVNNPALTVPAAGTGQTWNFSTLPTTLRDTTVLSPVPPVGSGFPAGAFYSSEKRVYGTGANTQSITVLTYQEVSASGWLHLARALPAFILAYPGIGELEYEAQLPNYTPALPMTPPFPVRLNDSVNINTTITENAKADAPGAGLTNAPTAQRTTYTGKVKAIATGTVTLPGYAAPLNALVLRRDLTIRENYFLNGAPASPLLLQALGLTDGETFTATYYDFYNYGGVGYLGTIVAQGSAVSWARFRRAN
ncbi:hypothetical protein [Flaviaesturariibacter amylovorans]|uniref:Lipoprotein n=1 Tax=Flaviaesturariibacter amylovorans TaxID=1084520 RepID=A0ABP8HFX4_9BACT